MCGKIAYGFWKKRSTVSSVCLLSCKKVKETGILIHNTKAKAGCTSENIAAAAERVRETPSKSIHSRSQELNILETS